MAKKIFWGIILAYTLYLLTGIVLLYIGKIEKYYFFPGFSIKHKIKEKGIVSTDGPIVLYRTGSTLAISIRGVGRSASISHDTVIHKLIDCRSFQTGDKLEIRLKDSLVTEPDLYSLPEKMLIISDIEGNFKGLKIILQGTNIINKTFDWNFGKGHLVLVGDFFDRGTDVTACLWLVYKLEEQAKKAGGKVHFIIGNHEVMNLTGKLHYLNVRYKANADTLGIKYERWYDKNTELGRWLRTKNVAEKIGDVLYLHAGISPAIAQKKLTLTEINNLSRHVIDKKTESFTVNEKLIAGKDGPYWYRGLAQQEIGQQELDGLFRQFKIKKMVIGHTILGDIQSIYNGRIVAIDIPHQENSDKGMMKALWYANHQFYIIDQNRRLSPLN
jgi:hypothetical protein